MHSLITIHTVELPLPTPNDRRACDERVKDILALGNIAIPLTVLKRLPAPALSGKPFACIVARTGGAARLVDIGTDASYGVALDLGTTNLVASLLENASGREVLVRSLENPQVAFGSDILTRMHHAMSGRRIEVYDALTKGINELIGTLCRDGGIERSSIHAMTVAGNTVMTHFFLGLDIDTIPVDPFIPTVRKPGFSLARELGIDINQEAVIYVFPNAGSYVGGDITAGIIASGMHEAEMPCLLIDVGTNAEVVLGARDWMIVGAGAAGPALEEGISRIGRRATKGIVYDVEIRENRISCKTFDQAEPEGICGSGMVSLVYELSRAGFIDPSGKIVAGPFIAEADGQPSLILDCGARDPLRLTQAELHNFLKSKAAMFTLLLVLTRSVGLAFREIKRVFVSGALGTGINPAKATGIGMLPDWPAGTFQSLGNSSLAGARMALRDTTVVDAADAIVKKITYKHMHDDPEFMKEFLGAVFIPHTNPEILKAG
ncbi:MAG TPA: ASKHA domain-containing protein [Nitrospirota bacterium]|nr:ASKHA domain-containing protein [Nitrospirota bacterium]